MNREPDQRNKTKGEEITIGYENTCGFFGVLTLAEGLLISFSALPVESSPGSLHSDSEEMKSETGGFTGTGSR